MSADDLFGEDPGLLPLRRPSAAPPPPVPTTPCDCGSTEWWVGFPSVCRKCGAAWKPPEPVQEALPGFPSDPVPHAPPEPEPQPEIAREEKLEVRGALRRLRDYRLAVDEPLRAAIDVVLARLEPEYPDEIQSAPQPTPQAPLFELGAEPAAVAAAEAIRVYVHFENFGDVREFGRRIGVNGLSSATRMVRYHRDRPSDVDYSTEQPVERGERDKTFDDVQTGLFGTEAWWEQYWRGMPTFTQRDLAPVYSIEMEFASWDDVDHFEARVDQTVPRGPKRTPSIWFPEAEIGRIAGRSWRTREPVEPRYPIFVISKGRADTRLTQRHLEMCGIPYRIVVEPQEFEAYAAVIPREKIIATPFSNLGQGSIPVRNFIWELAVKEGHARHWCLDDNIDGFYRLHENLKLSVETGATFRAIEQWSDRYENVGLSGMNYFMFASRKTAIAPLSLNTRVYSCILVNHALDLGERWRGRYNEDTDLSPRALKAGWCTALFNAFLCLKQTTMTMKGGNTEALYKIKEGEKDGRLLMAESLKAQHPDLVQIAWKWSRWQHQVDYRGFRSNQLRPKPGVEIEPGRDDFGMELVEERRAAA